MVVKYSSNGVTGAIAVEHAIRKPCKGGNLLRFYPLCKKDFTSFSIFEDGDIVAGALLNMLYKGELDITNYEVVFEKKKRSKRVSNRRVIYRESQKQRGFKRQGASCD